MQPLDWMDMKDLAGGGSGADPQSPTNGEAESILEGLNEAQNEAVLHADGPMLILAGAGSGKTRVITSRIAYLIATGRARPDEILAITFTNKAAGEMRERVARILPAAGMWISTFHAMCARILRSEIERLGDWTRDFTIYDTHDRNLLLKTITKELGYDTQRFRPAFLGSWISSEKAKQFDEERQVVYDDGGMETEVFVKVRDRYEAAMRENNALDFDDLLIRTLEIFNQHPGVRDQYASRFRYVLVDEYQDTNRIQYLLTRHLSGWHKNLAVCGDPDQSIYAWRGADIRNILDFEEDNLRASLDVKVVKLERNYRSTDVILRAAQGVIENNAGRREKDLWTEKKSERLIRVIECGDENDEAGQIVIGIADCKKRGLRLDQIAIFYRVNFMQRALERSLRMAGVPYQIVGGVEFYQRREVRDLVSYLHLIVNPKDDVACRRVINVPARGIGDKSLAALVDYGREHGISLLQAACTPEARANVRGRGKSGIAAFAELMQHLAVLADKPASMALQEVIDQTQYLVYLTTSGDADAESRVDNVEELKISAESFEKETPEGDLRGFLQEIALVSDVDGYDEEGPKVTLMTLHASKGLEFPAVFIAGVEEELMPHAMALAEGDDGVEEERRLMYVGMTRAEDELCLTYARTRMHFGESSYRAPSRFIDEIPQALVEGECVEDEDEVLGQWQPPEQSVELVVGTRVEHDHFGYGHVERLQGAGPNARVTVHFTHGGSKVLLVQYANLSIVQV